MLDRDTSSDERIARADAIEGFEGARIQHRRLRIDGGQRRMIDDHVVDAASRETAG